MVVCELLIAVASFVAEHRLQARGLQQLWHVGFSSCGSWALDRRLSSCDTQAWLLHGMWDLPGSGLQPVSPALAGGFLTTAPPGKTLKQLLFNANLFFFFFCFVFLFINLFIYLFLAALGLVAARGLSLVAASGDYSLLQCVGFLLPWLLLPWSTGCRARASVIVACRLQSAGSVDVVHGLSCSATCGIFPDQGSNSCAPHWQADS